MADRAPHSDNTTNADQMASVTNSDHYATKNISDTESINKYAMRIDELAQKLDSDELIFCMRDYEEQNVLKRMGYKNWGQFFDHWLASYGLSKSTFYHYVEVVDYSLKVSIEVNSETIKSLRSICKIPEKEGIRDQVWEKAKDLSMATVPPPDVIKKTHQSFKDEQQNPVAETLNA